jgi:hypothetical protein
MKVDFIQNGNTMQLLKQLFQVIRYLSSLQIHQGDASARIGLCLSQTQVSSRKVSFFTDSASDITENSLT